MNILTTPLQIAVVVGRQRSSFLFDVKCNLRLIFQEYTNVAQLIRDRQYDAPELVYLLKGTSDSYRKLPPILFPPEFENKLELIYLAPCLLRVSIYALTLLYML